MLTKETVIDRIEILEDNSVHVRRATYIVEDGKRIAGPMYHRSAYAVGAELTHEDAKVQKHAQAAWEIKGGGNDMKGDAIDTAR